MGYLQNGLKSHFSWVMAHNLWVKIVGHLQNGLKSIFSNHWNDEDGAEHHGAKCAIRTVRAIDELHRVAPIQNIVQHRQLKTLLKILFQNNSGISLFLPPY